MAGHKKMTPKKRQLKKQKPSTSKRYEARAKKREVWMTKNPDLIAGKIGEPSKPKSVQEAKVDEKKIDDAVEMRAEQAAAVEAP